MNGYLIKGYQKLKIFIFSYSCLHVLNFNEVSDFWFLMKILQKLYKDTPVHMTQTQEAACPQKLQEETWKKGGSS